MEWTVEKILKATGGKLLKGDRARCVSGISIDTRTLRENEAFVALRGERFDGHTFLSEAVAKKAAALVVCEDEGKRLTNSIAVVGVPDTLKALADLARYVRSQFDIPVVGITGSNGKTSTKEMVAAILDQDLKVLKNQGNYNNLIGVPLTLLKLRSIHDVALVEMGISVVGEMAQLAEISRPTAGLITNVQPAHLEGLGSIEVVLREKEVLWRSLEGDGVAIVNMDDRRLWEASKSLSGIRKITYSKLRSTADVHVQGEINYTDSGSRFVLAIGSETVPVEINVLGEHQLQNALAAAAVAHAMGVEPDQIRRGLRRHRPVSQRMELLRLGDGTIVVDDSYNANPGSMIAAFLAVRRARESRPFIAVLGEMRELGSKAAEMHWLVGKELGKCGVDRLITLGELGHEIIEGAVAGGISRRSCYCADAHDQAFDILKKCWLPGAWILIKGSRAAAMERIVEKIKAWK